MLTCTPHGHLTALCNLGGQRRKMSRPLRSGWEGWTNERVYCWGLPRCHGRRITAAHPSHRWQRAPHVLTGKSLWRVKNTHRAALTYSTTVQKPLRLQLKKATVVEKRLPLWVCFFVFRKTADNCVVTLCSWPNRRHTIHFTASVQTTAHTIPHMLPFCVLCQLRRRDDGWRPDTGEKNRAPLTECTRRTRFHSNSTSRKMRRRPWQQHSQQLAWQMLRAFT